MVTVAAERSEFSGRGWQLVLSSLLGIGLGLSPLPFYTMGIFAPHLAKEFGWQKEEIQFALAVTTRMVLWAGPLVGVLAKRVGVRRIAIGSVVLFSLAFMSLGLSTGSLTQFYVTFAAVAVFGAGTLPITWTRAVNGWFDKKRGLALGLSLMGTGIFGFSAQFFVPAIIAEFGWRWAYVAVGALPLLIAAPVALLLFHDSADAAAEGTAPEPAGFTVAETLADWRFWLMGLGFFGISLILGGMPPNLPDILTTGGLDMPSALKLTSLVGLSAIAGRVLGGWLVDRFWAPAVALVILGAPAIACWWLGHATLDASTAWMPILLVGFALGVEYDLMAYLLGRYFGLKSYTVSYAILYVFFSVGAGFGPPMFAYLSRTQGSYAPSLTIASVALIGVAASFLLLGKYRKFETA